jgi:tripartite-type tricarboxylate transporter receptor subunit TctC
MTGLRSARTPKETVARQRRHQQALEKPAVREAFAKIGAEPAGGSSEEFAQLVKSQVAHWSNVVTEAGIKLQP